MFKEFLLKWYNKRNPSILIWDVCLFHKEYEVEEHFYFLFHWAANLFVKLKWEEIKDEYRVTVGGEPLWLL